MIYKSRFLLTRIESAKKEREQERTRNRSSGQLTKRFLNYNFALGFS